MATCSLSSNLSVKTLHPEHVFPIRRAIIREHQVADKFKPMMPIQFQGLYLV